MNDLMEQLMTGFTSQIPEMISIALGMLRVLVTIDLIWSIISNFEQDYMKTIPMKGIKYGMWLWIISSYPTIIEQTTGYFVKSVAGSDGMVNLKEPGKLIETGIRQLQKILDGISTFGVVNGIQSIVLWVFGMAGYCMIAFQIFITMLEYYIVTTLAVLLLPFGVFPRTAFIAEKAIGAIISFSVKLMVLAFMAAVCIPMLDQFALTGGAFKDTLRYVIKVLSIGYLVWQGPGIAAGLMSGSPSLSGGGAVGAAVGVAAGTAWSGTKKALGAGAGGVASMLGGTATGQMAAAAYKAAAGHLGNAYERFVYGMTGAESPPPSEPSPPSESPPPPSDGTTS